MTKDSGGSQGGQRRWGVSEEEQPLAKIMWALQGPPKQEGRNKEEEVTLQAPSARIQPTSTFYSITLPTHVRWTPSPGQEAKAGLAEKQAG